MQQYRYFANVIERRLAPDDQVGAQMDSAGSRGRATHSPWPRDTTSGILPSYHHFCPVCWACSTKRAPSA